MLLSGSYHESLAIYKRVTIQAWPGETVWFDGSIVVSGWFADGAAWRYDGWTTEFDMSPTFTLVQPTAPSSTGGSSTPPLGWQPTPIRSGSTARRCARLVHATMPSPERSSTTDPGTASMLAPI